MAESFTFPDETVQAMQALQKTFGVKSNAEVITRALSLAKLVAEKAGDQDSVVVFGKDVENPVKLNLTK